MRYATLFLSLLPLACDPEPPAVQQAPARSAVVQPQVAPAGYVPGYVVANGSTISQIATDPPGGPQDINWWLRNNPGWFVFRGPIWFDPKTGLRLAE
jgi:hypothetical protein